MNSLCIGRYRNAWVDKIMSLIQNVVIWPEHRRKHLNDSVRERVRPGCFNVQRHEGPIFVRH